MHVSPSDTKWTLKAPSVLPCVYQVCGIHMEAQEGCPAWLLGWFRPVVEPPSLPAYLCLCISDVPRVRAAMPWHFKRTSKQLIGSSYLNMTPYSIRKGTLFTEGTSFVPLRLVGVLSLSLTGVGCSAESLAMKPLQPQYVGKSHIAQNKSMLKHLFSLAVY